MRVITLLLFMLAIFLINAHFIRVGEEENRIWPPMVLAVLSLILLLRTPHLLRVNWKLLVSPVVLLFALNLVWLGIVQFWSVAPAGGRSHIILLWLTLLAAIALSEERPYRSALAFVGCLCIVYAWSWAGAAAGQDWVVLDRAQWRLKGVMAHPQMLALVAIAGVIVGLIWQLNRQTAGAVPHRGRMTAFILVSLATLLATQGRSLTAFFVVTLFVVYFFHIKGPKRIWVLLGGIAIGIALYVAIDIILPMISRGQEETLSGRTIVWELTLREIAKAPFLGFGFGTYQDYFVKFYNNWAPGHAHNLWLQVTFESGLVGAVLYTFFLLALVQRGYRFQRDTGLVSYTLCLTIFCLMGGMTSVFLGEKLSTLYGLLLLLAVQEERLRLEALALQRAGTLAVQQPSALPAGAIAKPPGVEPQPA
ncbi:MAG: O-antigen ligase family protein [Geminicoccaceae bacterium]